MSLTGIKARSTCAWNPFPVYKAKSISCGDGSFANSNRNCIPVGNYDVTPQGSCSLAGPENPFYRVPTGVSTCSGYFTSDAKTCVSDVGTCRSNGFCECRPGGYRTDGACSACSWRCPKGCPADININMQMRNTYFEPYNVSTVNHLPWHCNVILPTCIII